MTHRLVSIIIDNYNYARFLRQAIDTALAQTYANVEVVVVDDGSTDNSAEIIRSYGKRVRATFKENGGQASAFNAGFAQSSGDIITFLDADDYLAPTAIEELVSCWKEDTDILHHRPHLVDDAGQVIGQGKPLDAGDMVPLLLRQGYYNAPPTSALIYSRRILEKIMPIPPSPWHLCADAYLTITSPFFSPVTVADKSVTYYRIHGANGFGPPMALRSVTRDGFEKHNRYEMQRRELVKQLAAEHGLPVPRYWVSTHRFADLLLYRSSSGYSLKKGAKLYVTFLKHLWSETGRPWPYTLKQTLVGLLFFAGPPPLMRYLFPRIFAEKA